MNTERIFWILVTVVSFALGSIAILEGRAKEKELENLKDYDYHIELLNQAQVEIQGDTIDFEYLEEYIERDNI